MDNGDHSIIVHDTHNLIIRKKMEVMTHIMKSNGGYPGIADTNCGGCLKFM
jgi:hypothetical protein